MANNNWFTCTNTVLALASLDQIADEATFDSGADNLEKYQLAAKMFVMLANQHLGLRCRRHFNKRLFSFTVQPPPGGWGTSINPPGGNAYGNCIAQLDLGIASENLTPHSFFVCNNPLQVGSQGTTLDPSQNRRLSNWKFEEFVQAYPQQQLITTNTPTRWILLPIDSGNIWSPNQGDDTTQWVQIYPNPDQQYTVIYQAKLNAQQVQKSTDLILFPPWYEHAIWEFAWAVLESDLGEGKEPMITQMAREAANTVELAAGTPTDIRKAPRMMRLRRRTGLAWYYNSPLSVDADGQPTPWG
jgi:hypothetical protein